MKGIILAGGMGTRLRPITKTCSKQLLPIYDKPMIFYPLSILLNSGINEICIVSTPKDLPEFKKLLGDGKKFGIDLTYFKQLKPVGIADVFNVTRKFIKGSSVTLILGDNIFFNFDKGHLKCGDVDGARVFCKEVSNPQRYGVVEFGQNKMINKIVEKPSNPPSNYAVTGLYQYDKNVIDYVGELKPSKRGELEITDLNNLYIKENKLHSVMLQKATDWFDTGTFSSLFEASKYVHQYQMKNKKPIGSPEVAAINSGLVKKQEMLKILSNENNQYSEFIYQTYKK